MKNNIQIDITIPNSLEIIKLSSEFFRAVIGIAELYEVDSNKLISEIKTFINYEIRTLIDDKEKGDESTKSDDEKDLLI